MCRDLRAFHGVKFDSADLLRVKDLTFRNSDDDDHDNHDNHDNHDDHDDHDDRDDHDDHDWGP